MFLAITTVCAAVLLAIVLANRIRDCREMERYSITPEALHALMASEQEVFVLDVRQPLDLLGDSVIIPGAQWIAPEEVRANPSLLPKGRNLVVYCTCPSNKTSRIILHRALAMGFVRIKFLKAASMAGGRKAFRSSHTQNPSISTRVAVITSRPRVRRFGAFDGGIEGCGLGPTSDTQHTKW
jgi:rhodanese-related sulfurtransferase